MGSDSQPKQRFTRPKSPPVARIGRVIRHPINRFLAGQSLIGQQAVFPSTVLPQLAAVSRNCTDLQQEAERLVQERENIPPLGKISPDHRRIASDGNWKSLFLQGYGYRSARNQLRCPKISAAIENTPGLVTAFISLMEPDTHVPSHRGLTKAWLNCHLPLVLPPSGRCEIAIDGAIHRWELGQWLVFDETFPHEVWNQTDTPRAVLFLQIKRPMRWPGRLLSAALFHAIKRSSFVQDVRQQVSA